MIISLVKLWYTRNVFDSHKTWECFLSSVRAEQGRTGVTLLLARSEQDLFFAIFSNNAIKLRKFKGKKIHCQ